MARKTTKTQTHIIIPFIAAELSFLLPTVLLNNSHSTSTRNIVVIVPLVWSKNYVTVKRDHYFLRQAPGLCEYSCVEPQYDPPKWDLCGAPSTRSPYRDKNPHNKPTEWWKKVVPALASIRVYLYHQNSKVVKSILLHLY